MFTKNRLTLLVALFAFIILLYGINLPFAGQHDWNSVMFSNAARNHLRYGLAKTKLGVTTNFGLTSNPIKFGFYTHHPPLLPILVSASFAVFGVTEWAGRLIPVLASVITVFFLFKLVYQLWGKTTAVLSAIFLALCPMLLYYSKIVVHEPVALGFIAMTFWFYIRWLKTDQKTPLILILVSLTLAQWTAWPSYYLSAYLPLHFIISQKDKIRAHKYQLLSIFFLAPINLLLHNLHTYLLIGDKSAFILGKALLFSLGMNQEASLYGFNYPEFFARQGQWISIYFTRIMLLLSIIWLGKFIFHLFTKRPIKSSDNFIFILLLFGFTHNAIFRNQSFIHDYLLIYALPFFAISSAITLNYIYQFLHRKTPYAYALVVLILVLFSVERLSYVRSLYQSGRHNPAVPLGKVIAQHTPAGANVVITSTLFMQYYDVFVRYYSDRRVSATTLTPAEIANADFLVIPKVHDIVSAESKQNLFRNYSYIDTPEGIIFDLRQTK